MAGNTLMSLLVRIGVDNSELKTGLNKSESMTMTTAKKISGSIGSLSSTIAKGVGVVAVAGFAAATAGVYALGKGISNAIQEAGAAEEISADLEATLKSTNGVSGMTVQSINTLSNSLASMTKFEDDAITEGANMLLTFTNIGKDVFPMATEAMLDMATKMGTDAGGAAIQLGKALNDPVAGITALTRVGVTFTEEQKAQIAAMVKMGDIAGAQKVILAELNKEFGGQAKAAGNTFLGVMARIKNTIGNISEIIGGEFIFAFQKIGNKIIPQLVELGEWLNNATSSPEWQNFVGGLADSIGNFASWVIQNIPKVITTLGNWFGKISPIMSRISENVKNVWGRMSRALTPFIEWAKTVLIPIFQKIKTKVESSIGPLITFFTRVFNTIADFIKQKTPAFIAFADKVKEGWGKLVDFLRDKFPKLFGPISNIGWWLKDVSDKVFLFIDTFRQGGLDAVFTNFAGGFSLFGELLKTLGVPPETADNIGKTVNDIYTKIKDGVEKVTNWIAANKDTIIATVTGIITGIRDIALWLVNAFQAVVKFLSENEGIIVGVFAAIAAAWLMYIVPIAVAAVSAFLSAAAAALPVIAVLAAVGLAAYALYEIWTNNMWGIQEKVKAAWDAIVEAFTVVKDAVIAVWNTFMSVFQPLVAAFKSAMEGDWYAFGENLRLAWDAVWLAIGNAVSAAWSVITSAVSRIVTSVIDFFTKPAGKSWLDVGIDIIKGIANGITSGVSWIVNAAKEAAKAAAAAVAGFFGAGSGKGNTGKGSGGNKAFGGSVLAGNAYTVGEHGPETFVPRTNGTIIPTGKSGGGTQNIYVTVHNPKAVTSEESVRKELMKLAYLGVA